MKPTGKQYYQADSGELICVLSLPTAMLDLPISGYGAIKARSFEAFEEHLPPQGTPVTLVLKPILSAKSARRPEKRPPRPNTRPPSEEGHRGRRTVARAGR